MSFNDLEYTREALIKQLLLVQNHGVDGSAVEGGCGCIEDKHLYVIEALAEEGATIATDPKEKEFYAQLADLSRFLRKKIDTGDFNIHNAMASVMQGQAIRAVKTVREKIYPKVYGNPRARAYLPHGLTECEKTHADVRKKLAACIKAAEVKCCGENTTDYSGCTCNPVAVCRASVSCPSASYTFKAVRVHRDLKKDVSVSEVDYQEGIADIHLNPKLQAYPKLEKTVLKHEINEVKCGFKCYSVCHEKAMKAEPKGDRKKILAIVGK